MRTLAVLASWAYATLFLASCSAAFSHGASTQACEDMGPRHTQSQPKHPGTHHITIHTSSSSYLPGDKIPVSVRSSRHFMGFLLQARTVADHQIAGTFVFTPRHSKLMACFEEADTVTHSDKSPKRKLLFMWKAPGHAVGDIRFLLSVVESYFVYWTRIESSAVSQQTRSGGLSQAPSPRQRPDAAEGAAPGAEDDSILDTALSSIRVTKLPGGSESLSQPLSHASTVSSNGQQPSGESSSTLRSFLGVPKVERLVTARKGSIDSFVSISGTQHRSQADSARASDCSSYESKHREHRVKDAATERVMGCLSKTDRRPEVKPEEASAPPEPQLSTLQLGMLICLPTILGVALAAGLHRLLHTQYCHKATERAFSEPTTDAVARGRGHRDNGEAVHARRTGDN
ncbi:LOW QUALITY PROTEIN: reelin domain-containing protein 1 [Acomys russatus]|uniref:LOW QUALITY PROTEIN: reelin domain-containing protein 1 n=1 Tax=Acomys russatus TaxID=60746 RepID=UPI0021E20216|nr:LOW QUALITY PROTEIN: reelin domain-containing protein 1 [Acomys russatus]